MSRFLRDFMAAAIRDHVRIRLQPDSLALAGQGEAVALSGTEADAAADAALAALADRRKVIVNQGTVEDALMLLKGRHPQVEAALRAALVAMGNPGDFADEATRQAIDLGSYDDPDPTLWKEPR